MTIQEALDRAKSLARARAAATGSPPNPPPLRTDAKDEGPTTDSADSQKHARQLAAPARPILRPARFESAEFNLVTCAENRILVPGGDKLLEARGAAAYRILRTRILQRVRANGWTAIGFTSPGPAEGKSVTAINLALTYSQGDEQQRILERISICGIPAWRITSASCRRTTWWISWPAASPSIGRCFPLA